MTDHLLIAYDIFVIVVGCSALMIGILWAVKSEGAVYWSFCALYACFLTLVAVNTVKKYILINLGVGNDAVILTLYGLGILADYGITAAGMYYFHSLYRIPGRNRLLAVFLLVSLLFLLSLFLPGGVQLQGSTLRLGENYRIGAAWYLLSFAYITIIGFVFIGRVWHSHRRTFVLGSIVFAAIGFVESLIGFLRILQNPVVPLAATSGFSISTVPFLLYGFFLIYTFLRQFAPASIPRASFDEMMEKFGITGREREIIRKVMRGKSNQSIASELSISLATVKTHLNNIYRKMDLDGRFELMASIREEQPPSPTKVG
jgi:DNA-binding CsgD family transcriptional regulator